jgi:endonuclease G
VTDEVHAVGNSVSVFAGPVLDNDNDPTHDFGLGVIQYPLRFWKVIAAVSRDSGQDELLAYGFILDQGPVVNRFGIEALDFGRLRRRQVSLEEISRQTGVAFPQILLDADTRRGVPNPVEIRNREDLEIRPGSRARPLAGARGNGGGAEEGAES